MDLKADLFWGKHHLRSALGGPRRCIETVERLDQYCGYLWTRDMGDIGFSTGFKGMTYFEENRLYRMENESRNEECFASHNTQPAT